MTHDDLTFDFSLQADADELELLIDADEDDDEDYDEEPGALSIRDLEAEKPVEEAAPVDTRTPDERTADLIGGMSSQRKVLLGILDFCKSPASVDSVNAYASKLQKTNQSVFTPANLCAHLESSGAIERITADGEPYASAEAEPQLVVIDGVEYYETRGAPTAYWRTTEVGLRALAADKPVERLNKLLSEHEAYLPVFEKILLICSAEGGASTTSLSDAIDDHPLLQEPRRFAAYFTERLEVCDALEWDRTWRTTDVGREGLKALAETNAAVGAGE